MVSLLNQSWFFKTDQFKETIKSTKDAPVQTETDDLFDELTMNNEKQSKVIHNILQHLDGRTGKIRFNHHAFFFLLILFI
jgi:hypothetical protein